MVIDIHVHPHPKPEMRDGMLQLAAAAGIDQVVLLGLVGEFGPYPTEAQVRQSNDATLAWMRARPDMCQGFCYLNPRHSSDFQREEVARCIDEGGMRGLKLWIALPASDARVDVAARLAAERGVPVLQHAWYKTVQSYEDESTPADVAALGRRHPDVSFIMAHLTGGGKRGVADIADVPNVLVDTSGSQPVAEIIDYAVRELGERRVVFGSDAWGRDFAVAVARVQGSALTLRQQRLVLGGNARALLRLEGAGTEAVA